MSSDDPKPEAETGDAAAPERRAYKKPTLRRLGSVRALTLGSTGGDFQDDGGFVRTAPPMM